MKSYYLPTLGKLDDQRKKANFANATLSLLLLALLPGAVLLILVAPYLVSFAFTPHFQPAARILAVLCLSLGAQAVSGFYSIYFLHFCNYWPHVLLDIGLVAVLVFGAAMAIYLHWPLMAVIWMYVALQCVLAGLYVWVACTTYGRAMLSHWNLLLGTGTLAMMLLAYAVRDAGIGLQCSLAVLVALLTFLLYERLFGSRQMQPGA
jgi:O-antigen/teichoic acid export membrane protein